LGIIFIGMWLLGYVPFTGGRGFNSKWWLVGHGKLVELKVETHHISGISLYSAEVDMEGGEFVGVFHKNNTIVDCPFVGRRVQVWKDGEMDSFEIRCAEEK
jgi:hypothetical protein